MRERRDRARHRHRDGAALVGDVGRDLRRARAAGGRRPGRRRRFTFVRSYHDHPAFVAFLAGARARGAATLSRRRARRRRRDLHRPLAPGADARRRHAALQALRLRRRRAATATACRRRPTSSPSALGLDHYPIAWQSAGRTADPWWGPPVEDVIPQLAAAGPPGGGRLLRRVRRRPPRDALRPRHRGARIAEEAGIPFARTRMPNADPAFLDVLAAGGARPPGAGAGGVSAAGDSARSWSSAAGSPASPSRTGSRRRDPAVDVTVLEAGRAAGGKLGSVEVGGLDAAGRRRLVRGAQAVGGRAVPRARRRARGAGRRSGAWLWTDSRASCRYPTDAPFGIPGDVGDRLPLAGAVRGRDAPRAPDLLRKARKGDDDDRSVRCCGGASATRRPTSPWRPLLAGLYAGDVDRLSRAGDVPRARGVGAGAGEPRSAGRRRREAARRVAARPHVPAAPRRRAAAHRRARRASRRPGPNGCVGRRPSRRARVALDGDDDRGRRRRPRDPGARGGEAAHRRRARRAAELAAHHVRLDRRRAAGLPRGHAAGPARRDRASSCRAARRR